MELHHLGPRKSGLVMWMRLQHPKSKAASAVFPDFQPSIFEFLDGGFCVGLVLSRRIHITNPRFLGPKW